MSSATATRALGEGDLLITITLSLIAVIAALLAEATPCEIVRESKAFANPNLSSAGRW